MAQSCYRGSAVRCDVRLRPLVWLALEELALDAVAEDGRLVARTSARRVAERLGVDPATAAAALRVLRDQGLVVLDREKGPAGRFGLSVYVLGPVAGLAVVGPGLVRPALAAPWLGQPSIGKPVGAATYKDEPSADRPDRAAPGMAVSHMASAPTDQSWPLCVSGSGQLPTDRHAVRVPRPASPRPGDAGLGRGYCMTAVRVASPEGWQVSVPGWLVGGIGGARMVVGVGGGEVMVDGVRGGVLVMVGGVCGRGGLC